MTDASSQLAPLSTALPEGTPPAELVFDAGLGPTLPELRDPQSGACLNGPAQGHVREALAEVDHALCELTLSRATGRLTPRTPGGPTLDTLELAKTVLKIEAACTVDAALLGRRIGLVLACSRRGRTIAPSVDVHLLDRCGQDKKTKAARNTLQSIAAAFFQPCAHLNLGPWMEASGLADVAAEAVLDLPLIHAGLPEPAMT